MKKILFLSFLFVASPILVDAHTPVIVDGTIGEIVETVESPEISRAYYGELTGSPHTFEVISEEPFTLFTQILVPDIDETENVISGIIIKLPEREGRVTEIKRLSADGATWDSEFEFFGGDSYRNGPSFEQEVEPGVYHIEVHTPMNEGKYVLVIGKEEVPELGYFETIRRIALVKEFFNKSQLMVVQSPFVYVPLLVIVLIGFVFLRRYTKTVRA